MSFLSRLGISRGKSSSSLRSRSSSSSSQGVTAVPQALPLATEFARVDGDEEDLYNVQIPRGVGAGGSFWLDVNGGKRVKIRVPQGLKPGQCLRVKMPPASSVHSAPSSPSASVPSPPAGFIDFTIPNDAREGEKFEVTIKGRRMSVTCPVGYGPGQTLRMAEPSDEPPPVVVPDAMLMPAPVAYPIASMSNAANAGAPNCGTTVNGMPATHPYFKEAGNYWHDPKSGLWGNIGGPSMASPSTFIQSEIPGAGELQPHASGGGQGTVTGVFVNRREIHPLDVQALMQIGIQCRPGRYKLNKWGYFYYENQHFYVFNALGNIFQGGRRPSGRGSGIGGWAGGGSDSYYHSDITGATVGDGYVSFSDGSSVMLD